MLARCIQSRYSHYTHCWDDTGRKISLAMVMVREWKQYSAMVIVPGR